MAGDGGVDAKGQRAVGLQRDGGGAAIQRGDRDRRRDHGAIGRNCGGGQVGERKAGTGRWGDDVQRQRGGARGQLGGGAGDGDGVGAGGGRGVGGYARWQGTGGEGDGLGKSVEGRHV